MGRGERKQGASSGRSLLFGPRQARPLSNEERAKRLEDLKEQCQDKLVMVQDRQEQAGALREIVARRSIDGYSFKYDAGRVASLLKSDSQTLLDISNNDDDQLLDLTEAERQQLVEAASIWEAAAVNIPPPSSLRRFSSRKHYAASAVNDARNRAAALFSPIEQRVSKSVSDQALALSLQANQTYYRMALGANAYQQFIADIEEADQLLDKPEQISSIFKQGQCLDRLSDQFQGLGNDDLAADLDLAAMHIAVNDRAEEYAERARSKLSTVCQQLSLGQEESRPTVDPIDQAASNW